MTIYSQPSTRFSPSSPPISPPVFKSSPPSMSPTRTSPDSYGFSTPVRKSFFSIDSTTPSPNSPSPAVSSSSWSGTDSPAESAVSYEDFSPCYDSPWPMSLSSAVTTTTPEPIVSAAYFSATTYASPPSPAVGVPALIVSVSSPTRIGCSPVEYGRNDTSIDDDQSIPFRSRLFESSKKARRNYLEPLRTNLLSLFDDEQEETAAPPSSLRLPPRTPDHPPPSPPFPVIFRPSSSPMMCQPLSPCASEPCPSGVVMDSSCAADHSITNCSLFESSRDRTNLLSRYCDEQRENVHHTGPGRNRILSRGARCDEQRENVPPQDGPVRKRILSRARCDEQDENFLFGPANKVLRCDLSVEKSPSLFQRRTSSS